MKSSPLKAWKNLGESTALKTPWFSITKSRLRTPAGTELDYYVHSTGDSVLCVCVTEDGRILIEEQYRPPIGKISVDYPAGAVEPTDKSIKAAAIRELREETGCAPKSIKKLATLDKDPGFSSAKLHVFLAQGISQGDDNPEPTEYIIKKFVSPKEVLRMIATGKLSCTFCVSATYCAFRELGLLDFKPE